MSGVHGQLPLWAQVSKGRRAHIERVVRLLHDWSDAMRLTTEEAEAWCDAGWGHDALRGAPEALLRRLTGDAVAPVEFLHGPAAAARFAVEGETRREVLDAIHWHTVGHVSWSRTGQALYMADFLEPGRAFLREERDQLAAQVPHAFETSFRAVVQMRLTWAIQRGQSLPQETVALWNALA